MIGNIDILVKEHCKLPKEIGWVEFKHNNCEPNMIGEDISALANTATLNYRDYAYMIWGVDDTTHEIIGTKVRLQMEKKGEQELENWLRYLLSKCLRNLVVVGTEWCWIVKHNTSQLLVLRFSKIAPRLLFSLKWSFVTFLWKTNFGHAIYMLV